MLARVNLTGVNGLSGREKTNRPADSAGVCKVAPASASTAAILDELLIGDDLGLGSLT